MRTGLLLTVALLATTSICGAVPQLAGKGDGAAASRKPGRLATLYDQTARDTGVGIDSQDFEMSFDRYDCMAADDFIVPDGEAWRVKQIAILGTYFDGIGPAVSETIVFYRDKHGFPGRAVASHAVAGDDNGQGEFTIALERGPKLKPGRYWISAQIDMPFNGSGQWGWRISDVFAGKPAVWRNPPDGFQTGCIDWTRETACLPGIVTGDHLFALAGRVLAED